MANVLTVPNSGIISFDNRAYSDLTVPPLSTSARIGYDGGGGVNITSYTTATTALDRFSVDGTQGRLFSVTDSLTGTLFSVNNITGLPILEVQDSNTVIAGQYNTNAFVLSGTRLGLGTTPLGTNRLSVSGDSTFVGNLSVTGLIQGDFGFIQQGGNTVTVPLSVGTNGGQSLILETNGANRVTILSSGQVGINTPNFKLAANSTNYLTVGGVISASNNITTPRTVYGEEQVLAGKDLVVHGFLGTYTSRAGKFCIGETFNAHNQTQDFDLLSGVYSNEFGPFLGFEGNPNAAEIILTVERNEFNLSTSLDSNLRGAYRLPIVIRKFQNASSYIGYTVNNAASDNITTAFGLGLASGEPAAGWGSIIATRETVSADGTLILRLRGHTTADTANLFYTSYVTATFNYYTS